MPYIAFFDAKKGIIGCWWWQEQNDILFRGTYGISLI